MNKSKTENAMFRCATFSACVALLLAFLAYLPTRSVLLIPYDSTFPYVDLPVASERGNTGPDVGCPVVTLGKNDQWIVAGVGAVSLETLRNTLIEERDAAHRFGASAWVNVRIGADKSARHVSQFFQIAEACGLDGVRVGTREPNNKKKG